MTFPTVSNMSGNRDGGDKQRQHTQAASRNSSAAPQLAATTAHPESPAMPGYHDQQSARSPYCLGSILANPAACIKSITKRLDKNATEKRKTLTASGKGRAADRIGKTPSLCSLHSSITGKVAAEELTFLRPSLIARQARLFGPPPKNRIGVHAAQQPCQSIAHHDGQNGGSEPPKRRRRPAS